MTLRVIRGGDDYLGVYDDVWDAQSMKITSKCGSGSSRLVNIYFVKFCF